MLKFHCLCTGLADHNSVSGKEPQALWAHKTVRLRLSCRTCWALRRLHQLLFESSASVSSLVFVGTQASAGKQGSTIVLAGATTATNTGKPGKVSHARSSGKQKLAVAPVGPVRMVQVLPRHEARSPT